MELSEKTLNGDFLCRLKELLTPIDYAAYLNSLSSPPMRTARLNPLKPVSPLLIKEELGDFPLIPPSASPGKSPLYAAGAYYPQEPAAAAVASIIPPLLPKNATVLDMCAAPGGKVTAAACARPDCTFLANEIVFSRAKILLSNVERMGARNVTVASLRPEDIEKLGRNMFDAVIADVPCSGEGMLRKEEFYSADLSFEAVKACRERAEKILDSCDICLKEGGLLFFSTCTFNREENEEQVFRLIAKGYEPIDVINRPKLAREGFGISRAMRFFPQDGAGEGHFACVLQKVKSDLGGDFIPRRKKPEKLPVAALKAVTAAAAEVSLELLPPENITALGEGFELVPQAYPFYGFPALRRGMKIADVFGGRAELHHNFATAAIYDKIIAPINLTPDSPLLKAYLKGDEFEYDGKGYKIVCVCNLPLGLVKLSQNRAKNKYPKGLRL